MEFDLEQLQRDWVDGISGVQLFDKVRSLAEELDQLPATAREQGVLIAESDPIRFTVALFAAVASQTPVVLANPEWNVSEWGELGALVTPVRRFGSPCNAPAHDSPESSRWRAPKLRAGSILIPTGGTTGGVKLAIHNWRSLASAVHGLQQFLGGGPIHSACQLPLFHVSGLMQLVRSFITGGRIHFDRAVRPGDCLSLVPTQLQRAMQVPEQVEALRTARAIFLGGAAMPQAVAQQARELELPVVPVYGMTETAAMVAAIPNHDFLADSTAGALPLGAARFEVIDGQIRIQSPALFQGYQGQPEVDLREGYLTGDGGELDQAGRLHVMGRLDDLINTGGEKVDPREVEAVLLEIEGVEGAKVFGRDDPEWGQVVVAQVHSSSELDFEIVRAQLKRQVAAYKVPKHFERI